MPGLGQTLVIGGGIAAGSPFALDQFLYVTNVTQPTAASYPGLVRGTNAITAPGTQAAASKRNTAIGPNFSLTNTATEDGVFVGSGLSGGTGSTPTTCIINIGKDNQTPNTTAGILLGGSIVDGGSTSYIKIGSGMSGLHNDFIGIGFGVTPGGGSNGVTIGRSAGTSVGGGGTTIVGNSSSGQTNTSVYGAGLSGFIQNCTVVGQGISITGGGGSNLILIGGQMGGVGVSNAIAIGNGASIQAGVITIGNCNLGALGYSTSVLWGGESTHVSGTAVPAWAINHKNAAGTDIAAGDVTWTAPLATGAATSGKIIFRTGVAGGAGTGTLQTAASVFQITNAQKAEVMVDNGLTFTSQTSGAGAAGGTLTNAPSAGNPSHWLRVQINGANRFIPCWT